MVSERVSGQEHGTEKVCSFLELRSLEHVEIGNYQRPGTFREIFRKHGGSADTGVNKGLEISEAERIRGSTVLVVPKLLGCRLSPQPCLPTGPATLPHLASYCSVGPHFFSVYIGRRDAHHGWSPGVSSEGLYRKWV